MNVGQVEPSVTVDSYATLVGTRHLNKLTGQEGWLAPALE